MTFALKSTALPGIFALLAMTSTAAIADTLSAVLKKKSLQCGVSQGLPGFSAPNKKGQWKGIDVDICRAVAAAVFGNANQVKYSPLSSKDRFTALQSKEIDLLSRNTTWTLVRDSKLGLDFAGVTYYDGQGFLVKKALGVKSAIELNGATICVNLGTTTELNVADYFRKNKLKYKIIAFEKTDEVVAAYDSGRCDVYTTDQSGLYANLIKLKQPSTHMILPEVVSKEPLGPVVRHGDNHWGDIVRWTLFALLEAEELGLSSKNVDSFRNSPNPKIRRFLGLEGNMGKNLGLSNDWAYNIVKQVGNYEQVFSTNLGAKSPLKINRGLNKLWKNGGLHYPMPVR